MSKYIVLILFYLIAGSPLWSYSDPKIRDYFKEQEVNVIVHRDSLHNREYRYIETYTDPSAKNVVFLLHGAQSHAMRFKKIMSNPEILSNSRIISLDRPGYAASSPGEALPGIQEQAAFIEQILDRYYYESCVLVAHSYGAAIAAYYASENPNEDLRLIMLSPAIDPELEKVFPISKVADNPIVKRVMPDRSYVASLENIARKEELMKIQSIWKQLDIPIYHVHGVQDMVIPFENIYFSMNNINTDMLQVKLLADVGHSLIRYRSEEIVELIRQIQSEESSL